MVERCFCKAEVRSSNLLRSTKKKLMNKDRPYNLEKYNPLWVDIFNTKKDILLSILKNEVITIEHIGSTSIPGMTAKPQIDIMVVVKNLADIQKYYTEMEKAGFTSKGDYVGIGEEYFTEDNPVTQKRITSIHVKKQGDPEIESQLNFRNYLRNNEADRNLYMSIKEKLYREYPDNYSEYDTGKRDIINQIRERATLWAKSE